MGVFLEAPYNIYMVIRFFFYSLSLFYGLENVSIRLYLFKGLNYDLRRSYTVIFLCYRLFVSKFRLLGFVFFLTVDSVNFHIRISEIFLFCIVFFIFFITIRIRFFLLASSLTFSNARFFYFFLHFVFFS